MPIQVSDVLTKAAIVLNDEEFVRWTKDELIGWLNDAAPEVVIRRPSAHAITDLVELQEGVLQELPQEAIQLLDIPATETGHPINRTDRHLLDQQAPGWRRAKPGRTRHYTYDERSSLTYYVYPAAVAGAKVEVFYSTCPAKVASDTDTLDMDRAYIGPLISYILYRALAKDSEYANGVLAAAHYSAFSEALGLQNQTAGAVSPNAN